MNTNAETAAPTPPDMRGHRVRWSLLVFIVAMALGCFARRAYFDARYVLDDLDLHVQLSLYDAGRVPTWVFLAAPLGPHPMLLWKLVYLGQWQLFGLDPVGYRMVMNLVQAVSATALFVLLSRYGIGLAGSLLAALLWATAAIGGFDNPLLWAMCGMIPLSAMWFLGSMACVSFAHGSHSRLLAALAGLFVLLALLSWGNIVILLPVLPLLFLLLERRDGRWPRAWRWWLLAWLVPALTVGLASVLMVLPSVGARQQEHPVTRPEALVRTATQLCTAATTMIYSDPRDESNVSFTDERIVGLLAAIAALLVARRNGRRLIVVLLALAGMYLLVANLAGTADTLRGAVSAGRYAYLPTLTWCAIAGIAFGGLVSRSRWLSRPSVATVVALFLIFPLHLSRQDTIAAATRARFDEVSRHYTRSYELNRRLLEQLALQAERRGRPVRLAELPVPIPAPSQHYWPLSAFLPTVYPEGVDRIEVIAIDRVSAHDIETTRRLLSEIATPLSAAWSELSESLYGSYQELRWLADFGQTQGIRVRLPRFWYNYRQLSLPAESLVFVHSSDGLGDLQITSDVSREELQRLLDRLEGQAGPQAELWRERVRQMLSAMSTG